MNASRRARRQSIPEHEREALLARRKANAAARRNTPCAQSIAMSCPNAAALATLNPASSTHIPPTREGDASPPVSPLGSTSDCTIGTDGDSHMFTPLLMLRLIKPLLTCYKTLQVTWRPSLAGSWTRMLSLKTSWTMSTTYLMMKVRLPAFPSALPLRS